MDDFSIKKKYYNYILESSYLSNDLNSFDPLIFIAGLNYKEEIVQPEDPSAIPFYLIATSMTEIANGNEHHDMGSISFLYKDKMMKFVDSIHSSNSYLLDRHIDRGWHNAGFLGFIIDNIINKFGNDNISVARPGDFDLL